MDDTLAEVKRALSALRAAKARIQELERGRNEPIAIVGVGCRFPGAPSPEALWDLLLAGRDGLSRIPADRWDADAWWHPDPAAPGRMVVRTGGFLSGIEMFDPDYFGIPHREAALVDPQQRLLLEVSAEAFARAGMQDLRGSRTAVFVGVCGNEFAQGTMFSGDADRVDPQTGTGSAISMAAGRLSYTFGLEGPASTVDTACSSSLVAVHLAVSALRSGECDAALAAGVNVMLSPLVTVFFSRMGVLTPSGRIRAFDAGADGYLRSDGCGAIVLKRLSDAERARDPILAVLRGTALGQNGRGNGLTSPNGRAQEATIRRALENAGKTPADVGYVEAFGAATPIGDRIELEALDRVFGRDRAPLWLGSVKTNLGHAEGAAGMASLVKAVLSVAHGLVPPSLHWQRPPPGLPWDDMALRVAADAAPLAGAVGVSAWGFSGTNAHVVLDAGPTPGWPAPRVAAPVFDRRRFWPDVANRLHRPPGARPERAAVPSKGAAERPVAAAGDPGSGQPRAGSPDRARDPARPASAGRDGARGSPRPAISAELADLDEDARALRLEAWLGALFSDLLGRPVPPDAELAAAGLDSVVTVDAIGRMITDLGVQVYPTELYEHGTIAALARHLSRLDGERREATAADHAAARDAIVRSFAEAGATGAPVARRPAEMAGPPPVFVLSSPRAGSTLLRVMLAGHPALFAPPELHLLLADDLAAWHRRLSPELLTLGLVQAQMGLGMSEDEALRWLDAHVAAATPVPSVYAALAERLGGRRLVDKSPSYGFDPEALRRAERWFPDARYVWLVRHPYSVIESFGRLRMGRLLGAPDAPPEVAGEQAWALSAERIGTFLAGIDPSRHIRVRYEDLVADPGTAMERLCAFLGVAPDPAMLEPYRGDRMIPSRHGRPSFLGDPGFSRHGRIDPSLGERWREAPVPVQAATAAIARSLGYELDPNEVPLPGDVGPGTGTTHRASHAPGTGAMRRALEGASPDPTAPRTTSEARAGAARFGSILLTGATGFLGTWILADLLDRGHRVVALVRAADRDAGRQRLRASLAAIGRELTDAVTVVPGDLALPGFGADPAALAGADAVIHNGAVVHFSLGRRQLAGPNIGGTIEALRLGRPVVHVSTKGVFSPSSWGGDGPIPEDVALRPMDPRSSGYQHTKWTADRLVAQARERGIPAAIARPGRIGGDASGRVPADDLLVRFVRGCVEIGAIPDVDGVVELIPVDVVARAVVAIVEAGAYDRAFHLVHPEPTPVTVAAAAVRDAGYDLALLPYAEWRSRLLNRPDGALRPVLALFGERPPVRLDERRLDRTNARTVMPGAIPSVPDQLRRMVRFLEDEGLLRRTP